MVVEHAYSTFMKNLGILVLFSVAFLLGLLMPLLASTPTYSAMGGVHLRFMSIPTMGWIDALAIGVAFLLSNYLVAFGLVAVNLIVKRERTAINLTTEVIKAISRYTFSIFLVFVLLFIINTALQFALVALEAPYLVSALVFLLIYLPVFYIGPAVVIDDLKPAQAVRSSIAHIKMYPVRVVKWTAGGLALLFATAYASHFLFPAYFQWITILINSFLIIPFLLVYQAHNYIEKYGILKRPVKRGKKR